MLKINAFYIALILITHRIPKTYAMQKTKPMDIPKHNKINYIYITCTPLAEIHTQPKQKTVASSWSPILTAAESLAISSIIKKFRKAPLLSSESGPTKHAPVLVADPDPYASDSSSDDEWEKPKEEFKKNI